MFAEESWEADKEHAKLADLIDEVGANSDVRALVGATPHICADVDFAASLQKDILDDLAARFERGSDPGGHACRALGEDLLGLLTSMADNRLKRSLVACLKLRSSAITKSTNSRLKRRSWKGAVT